MATTLFPHLDVVAVAGYLGVAMVVLAAAATAALRWLSRRRPTPVGPEPIARARAAVDRGTWRMPPLTLLQPVTWSTGTRLGMLALRGYLIIGAVLLVVKAIQLGRGLPRPRLKYVARQRVRRTRSSTPPPRNRHGDQHNEAQCQQDRAAYADLSVTVEGQMLRRNRSQHGGSAPSIDRRDVHPHHHVRANSPYAHGCSDRSLMAVRRMACPAARRLGVVRWFSVRLASRQ